MISDGPYRRLPECYDKVILVVLLDNCDLFIVVPNDEGRTCFFTMLAIYIILELTDPE